MKVGFRLVNRRGKIHGDGQLSRNAICCIRLILLRHCFFITNNAVIYIVVFC